MTDFLAVVVLYKTEFGSSLTLQSLNAACDISTGMDVIVYDNSPSSSFSTKIYTNLNIDYIQDDRNLGLANAYNAGLKQAISLKKKWILLLDQDTNITTDYLLAIKETLQEKLLDKEVVALCPILKKENRHLSPISNRSTQNVWWFQKNIKKEGCYTDYITAFNSGTLLRIDFMESIGGFSEKYPIDRLDYWYFLQIHKNKKKVYVLNAELEHDLSVLDYNKNMNLSRYQLILESELMFAKGTGTTSLLLYKILIFFRFFKQLIFYKNKRYAGNTFSQFWK